MYFHSLLPESITYAVSPVCADKALRAKLFATTVVPPDVLIPCSTVTARGGRPLCTENTPKSFKGVPVVWSNSISPPSVLVSFNDEPVEALVDRSQPVPEFGPATGLPEPSLLVLTIVIDPPVDAVVGVGADEAVTPCVAVLPLMSDIVCVNVVLVNVTAVSLISKT